MSWKDILKNLTEYEEAVAEEFAEDEDMEKPKHKIPDIDDGMANLDWMNDYIRKPKTAGQKTFIARAKKNLDEEKRNR
tara:strand:- start:224 stop:457 length:234 start_codon:yes stop_codon:yes gene_type:complete